VRHDGRTDEGKHRWSMELRNRYREPVHVSWALADYEVAYRDIEVIRDKIGIGGSVSHGFDIESSPAGQFRVRIHRVRLGERDEGDYRGCDKM
jgi:hypothetical protein